MRYEAWIKNLPKNIKLPRARYDSRRLLDDINITINIDVSGFNLSQFLPTPPIIQPRRENVDPRWEQTEEQPIEQTQFNTNTETAYTLEQLEQIVQGQHPTENPGSTVIRRAEFRRQLEEQDRGQRIQQVYNPDSDRWVLTTGERGRRILDNNPNAPRRDVTDL